MITNSSARGFLTTASSTLSFEGCADSMGYPVTQVVWTNTTARKGGLAWGTATWSVADIPLVINKTNTIVVTGTTTSWSAGYGGNTTFNETVAILNAPVKASLSFQNASLVLTWTGGAPPFQVERSPSMGASSWEILQSDAVAPIALPRDGDTGFLPGLGPLMRSMRLHWMCRGST